MPFLSGAAASPPAGAGQTYHELQLFGRAFDLVRQDYVEKPESKKLIGAAINGMVSGLDPHSNYMDAKAFGDMQAETSGQFGGLGMQVTMENGRVKVVSPIDDTPAAKAGILAGDFITRIDDQVIADLPLNEVVTKLRGTPGSSVKLEIQRANRPAADRENADARDHQSAVGSLSRRRRRRRLCSDHRIQQSRRRRD